MLFYWISVLDNVRNGTHTVSVLFFFFSIVATLGLIMATLSCNDIYSEDRKDEELQPGIIRIRKLCKGLAIFFWTITTLTFTINILLPTKKDAMVIVAGIGVVEAVKSDTAKSFASKSTQIIENWLDEQVAATGVKAKEAAKQVAKTAVEEGKKTASETAKEVVSAVKQ